MQERIRVRNAEIRRENGVQYLVVDTETGIAHSEPFCYDFAKYVCEVKNGPHARYVMKRME